MLAQCNTIAPSGESQAVAKRKLLHFPLSFFLPAIQYGPILGTMNKCRKAIGVAAFDINGPKTQLDGCQLRCF